MFKLIRALMAKSECAAQRHAWTRIGLWSDQFYRCKPILRCRYCGVERYEGMDDG